MTTFGLNGAMSALQNGIMGTDEYYRKGVPPAMFKLSAAPGAPAGQSLEDRLHALVGPHRHSDPFAMVEGDLSQLTSSIRTLIGSDHPVLMTVAKYFFEINGMRCVLCSVLSPYRCSPPDC
jgi:hypothetical protein